MKQRWVVWGFALGSYFLLACFFFYPFFQGKVLFYIDNLLHLAPAYTFWKKELLAGHLPLWNPYVFAGIPFLADPSHAAFSPLAGLFFLFQNPLQALTFQAIVLAALASLGGFFLARRLRLSLVSSWLVGIWYGFSGLMFETSGDANALAGMAWLPWFFGFFIEEVVRKRRFFSVRLAGMLALFLISSHTQYAYYALVTVGLAFILLEKPSQTRMKAALGLAATILLGLGLAAIQLVPAGELALATRRNTQLPEMGTVRASPLIMVSAILPRLFGSLVQGNSWGPGSQLEHGLAGAFLYVSLPALVLAGVAVILERKNRLVQALVAGVVLSLLLAWEDTLPILDLVKKLIPGWQWFRSPLRILSLYSLGMTVLAGLGWEAGGRLVRSWPKARFWRVLVSLGMGLGGLALLWWVRPGVLADGIAGLYSWLRQRPIAQTEAYSWQKIQEISRLVLESGVIFFLGLLALMVLLWFRKTGKNIVFVMGASLLVAELFIAVRGSLFFAPPNRLLPDKRILEELRALVDHQRIASVGEIQAYSGIWNYFNHLGVRPPFSSEPVTDEELISWNFLHREINQLPANIHQQLGLKSATGYAALIPNAYREYTESKSLNHVQFGSYTNPLLNDFAVSYLVDNAANNQVAEATNGQFQEVFRNQQVVVYQNIAAKPRAEISGGQVAWEKDESDELVLAVEASQAGSLVLRDFWYPGWKVSVDGDKVALEPYQNIFRQVSLTPGKHRVIFTYAPESLKWGGLISGGSLLLVGMIILKESKLLWS